MKLAAKLLAVLSVLALAAPALACGDKETTAKSDAKAQPAQTVAKADAKKKSATPAKHSSAKPATATASN